MKTRLTKFGDIEFYSEDALSDFVLGVRDVSKISTPITGRNERILTAILSSQPNVSERIAGREVSHFEVHRNKFGKRALVVVLVWSLSHN